IGRRGIIEWGQRGSGDQAARREFAIFGAKAQIVAHRQLFTRVETTDEPVELAVERLTLQAQLLGEGVELAIGVLAVGAIQNIDRAIVEVAGLTRTIFTVTGDRGQRRAAEIPVDLAREAVILGLAGKAAAWADPDIPAIALAERGGILAEVGEHAND